jgi:NAD(P)H-quinone oxidoreductase subunit 4
VEFEDRFPALILAGLIAFLGIQPSWLVKWSEATSTAMVAAVPTVEQIATVPDAAVPDATVPDATVPDATQLEVALPKEILLPAQTTP